MLLLLCIMLFFFIPAMLYALLQAVYYQCLCILYVPLYPTFQLLFINAHCIHFAGFTVDSV